MLIRKGWIFGYLILLHRSHQNVVQSMDWLIICIDGFYWINPLEIYWIWVILSFLGLVLLVFLGYGAVLGDEKKGRTNWLFRTFNLCVARWSFQLFASNRASSYRVQARIPPLPFSGKPSDIPWSITSLKIWVFMESVQKYAAVDNGMPRFPTILDQNVASFQALKSCYSWSKWPRSCCELSTPKPRNNPRNAPVKPRIHTLFQNSVPSKLSPPPSPSQKK